MNHRTFVGITRAIWVALLVVIAGACTGRSVAPEHRQVFIEMSCERKLRVDLPLFGDQLVSEDSSVLGFRLVDLSSPRSVYLGYAVLLQDSSIIAEVATDNTGAGEFRVRSGTYRLEIRTLGYHRTWSDVVLSPGTRYSRVEVPLWVHPIC